MISFLSSKVIIYPSLIIIVEEINDDSHFDDFLIEY